MHILVTRKVKYIPNLMKKIKISTSNNLENKNFAITTVKTTINLICPKFNLHCPYFFSYTPSRKKSLDFSKSNKPKKSSHRNERISNGRLSVKVNFCICFRTIIHNFSIFRVSSFSNFAVKTHGNLGVFGLVVFKKV
jgi:hypothetical protein